MDLTVALDDCLDAMGRGETLADCLRRYPQHAAELEAMLRTAARLHPLAGQRLSDGQRLRGLATIREAEADRIARSGSSPWPFRLIPARSLAAALLAVLVLALASTSVVVARSQPGAAGYALRVVVERFPAVLQRSVAHRATYELRVAERRLAELDSFLRTQGRVNTRALQAVQAGQQAAVRYAQRLTVEERNQIAQRLAQQARTMMELAPIAPNGRGTQALEQAARRALGLIQDLPGPPSLQQDPGGPGSPRTPTPTWTPPAPPASSDPGQSEVTSTPEAASTAQPTPVIGRTSQARPRATPARGQPEATVTVGATGSPGPTPLRTRPPRPRPSATPTGGQEATATVEITGSSRPTPLRTPPPRPRPGATSTGGQEATATVEITGSSRPTPSRTRPPRPRPSATPTGGQEATATVEATGTSWPEPSVAPTAGQPPATSTPEPTDSPGPPPSRTRPAGPPPTRTPRSRP